MNSVCARVAKVLDSVVTLECWVAVFLFSLTGVIMFAQVFMRWVVNLPFVWAEDLTVFLFVWVTFLGAAVLYHRKTVLSIDTLVSHLSPRTQRRLGAGVDLLLLVSILYITVLAYQFFERQRGLGHTLGGATGIPSYMMTMAVIVGLTTMFLSTAASLLEFCLQAKR